MPLITYRPIEAWPGPLTIGRKTSPFDADWASTLDLLDRELNALNARNVVLQVAVTERDIRANGDVRGDARPEHPGVILSFGTPKHGALSYPCDTFEHAPWKHQRPEHAWRHNVRAIALGLEALRKVERYGIAPRGEQYTGWKALGAGTPMPAAKMTVEDAARFIALQAGPQLDLKAVLEAPDVAYRRAAKRLHPDAGGLPEVFKRLVEAKRVLDEHGGAT
jgi:hypothetical protein